MARKAKPKQVIVYADEKSKELFINWLYALHDAAGRRRILAHVTRLAEVARLLGDSEKTGEAVYP